MSLQNRTIVAAAGLFVGVFASGARAGNYSTVSELDQGHRVLLQRGLQVGASSYAEANGNYFDMNAWHDSNFNSLNLGLTGGANPQFYGNPGDFQWSNVDWYGRTQLLPVAQPYARQLVAFQYIDEQDMANPANRTAAASFFTQIRADPTFNDVILYTNQSAAQNFDSDLKAYMATAKPDMLMFDSYYWGVGNPAKYNNGSPTATYQAMAKYRNLALAGNDGTGQHPIPYARYLQAITENHYLMPDAIKPNYLMSESAVRLEQFASWAFGYQFTTAFAFDAVTNFDSTLDPVIMVGTGAEAQKRQPQFAYWAETNRQSLNLGPSLVALLSTDVRMVTGAMSNKDHGVREWDTTADPYMKNVTATNLGRVNEGTPGDVLIGYYQPISEDLDGPDHIAERYFMIVNGLTGDDASASDASQLIRIDFDLGNSGIDSLLRRDRDTGAIEEVPLIHDAGSLYHLDLTLEGGTGDLFKYDDGATFVAAPEPGGVALLLAGVSLIGGLGRRRRIR